MARDALGAGDTVMAENYLQHAEHYNRIIAAAQAQLQERYQRDERDNQEREQPQSESTEAAPEAAEKDTAEVAVDGTGPQPVISGTPAEVAIGEDAQQQQPTRRSPLRRRAPGRPRRNRQADEAPRQSEEQAVNGSGAENETPQTSEAAPAPSESQENPPEVAAVARGRLKVPFTLKISSARLAGRLLLRMRLRQDGRLAPESKKESGVERPPPQFPY